MVGKFIGVLLLIALGWGFIDTYDEYYQGVRARESYSYARAAASSSEKYFIKNMKFTESIDELKLENPNYEYVGQIGINKQSGIISIKLAGDSLDEGELIFSPRTAKDGQLIYICQYSNVPVEFVPTECVAKSDDFHSTED